MMNKSLMQLAWLVGGLLGSQWITKQAFWIDNVATKLPASIPPAAVVGGVIFVAPGLFGVKGDTKKGLQLAGLAAAAPALASMVAEKLPGETTGATVDTNQRIAYLPTQSAKRQYYATSRDVSTAGKSFA